MNLEDIVAREGDGGTTLDEGQEEGDEDEGDERQVYMLWVLKMVVLF